MKTTIQTSWPVLGETCSEGLSSSSDIYSGVDLFDSHFVYHPKLSFRRGRDLFMG